MPDHQQPGAQHDPAELRGAEALPYQAPVLRSHGTLRDLTAQFSGAHPTL